MGESNLTEDRRVDRGPRVYKVTNGAYGRFWVLRIPDWFGRVLDWHHRFKYGFTP